MFTYAFNVITADGEKIKFSLICATWEIAKLEAKNHLGDVEIQDYKLISVEEFVPYTKK